MKPPRESLIAGLVPASASAECHRGLADVALFGSEADAVAGACPTRRREFAMVRACARVALRGLGIEPCPILPDSDRVPRWPAGVVGSMTHCPGYRAAVVARAADHQGIAVDAEPHAGLPGDVAELLLREDERACLRPLQAAHPEVHWDRVTFCAKEAVFKAWYPVARHWLDFDDVSTRLCPDGSLQARIPGRVLAGQWVIGRGLVAVGAWLERTEARP